MPNGSKESVEPLALQIDYVLGCAYTPSLSKLAEALRLCTLHGLDLWVDYADTKTTELIAIVAATLDHDTQGLGILQRLAQNIVLRNEILVFRPHIIASLIAASLSNDAALDRNTAMIASLLHHELPSTCILPAALGQYIHAIIQIINSGRYDFISNLELILRNNANHCLRTMSRDQYRALQSTLSGLLAATDTSNVLLALSCLASIYQQCDIKDNSLGTESKALFCGNKGQKVVKLIFNAANAELSRIISTTDGCCSDQLVLAINVIRALENSVVSEWMNFKEGHSITTRMLHKMAQMDTKIVRDCALFISCCVKWSAPIRTKMQSIADDLCKQILQCTKSESCTSSQAETFCLLLEFTTDRSQLVTVMLKHCLSFDAARARKDWTARANCHGFRTLITGTKDRQKDLQPELKNAISSTFSELCWTKVFDRMHGTQDTRDSGFRYSLALCTLAIDVLKDVTDAWVSELLSTIAIIFLSHIEWRDVKQHKSKSRAPVEPVADLVMTSFAGSSRQWRNDLLHELENDSKRQHIQIISRLELVCRDLESRSEEIERPLILVEEEKRVLQGANALLQSRVSTLMEEKYTISLQLQSSEEEQSRVESISSGLIDEVQESHVRLVELEMKSKELSDNLEIREEMLQNCESKASALKNQLSAQHETFTGQLQALKAALREEEKANDRLTAELLEQDERLQTRDNRLLELRTLMDTQVEEHEQRNAMNEVGCTKRDQAIEALLEKVELLEHERLSLTTDLSAEQSRVAGLNSQVVEQLQRQEQLSSLHLLEQTRLQEEYRLASTALESSNADLTHQLKQRDINLESLKHEFCKDKESLGKELQKLRTAYEKRGSDILKAQELSKSLISVMQGSPTPSNLSSGIVKSRRSTRKSSTASNRRSQSNSAQGRGQTNSTQMLKNNKHNNKENMAPVPETETNALDDITVDTDLYQDGDSHILRELLDLGI